MGKAWDHHKGGRDSWVAWLAGIMREGLRVLKPGGHALVWALPRTSHWTALALEDAGFEIRDSVLFLFGAGFPKGTDVGKMLDKAAGVEREIIGPKMRPDGKTVIEARPHGSALRFESWSNVPYDRPWKHDRAKVELQSSITAPATPAARQWDGWNSGLKPGHEVFWLCRKPLSEKNIAANVLKWGVGGINVGGCAIPATDGYCENRVTQGMNTSRSSYDVRKQSRVFEPGKGRYPANVITDGSPAIVDRLPMTKSGKPSGQRHIAGYATAVEHGTDLTGFGDSGSAARFYTCCPPDPDDELDETLFFYGSKAGRRDREEGLEGLPEKHFARLNAMGDDPQEDIDPVSARFTTKARNHHPCCKSVSLMKWLTRLVTPPGGTVLDCFAGSGSTGKACMLEGFRFIGIEQDAEYCAIAQRRIAWAIAEADRLAKGAAGEYYHETGELPFLKEAKP